MPLLSQRYGVEEDELSGWVIAENLSATSGEIQDPALRGFALKLAARAVLRKAFQLVGPVRMSRRLIREVMAEPFRGDLDEEETLENLMGKRFPDPEDWISSRREVRRTQVVLMMDTSLSMSGKNLALAAVAAAVLAFKVKPEDLAVIAFESSAHVLTRLGERDSVESVVEQVLSQPARGFTNLEDALAEGRTEMLRGDERRTVGLLITDGVSTAGGDPVPLAADFPRLHVLLTEDYVMDEEICRRIARLGRGETFLVRGYADLPRRMLEVANKLLR
jgi:Mg-chelatase subunit ChlD